MEKEWLKFYVLALVFLLLSISIISAINVELDKKVKCVNNDDCGKNDWAGKAKCSKGDVYQKWKTYECNAGICEFSVKDRKKRNCLDGCNKKKAVCKGEEIRCNKNKDCGRKVWASEPLECGRKGLYQKIRWSECVSPGKISSYCKLREGYKRRKVCDTQCVGGKCEGDIVISRKLKYNGWNRKKVTKNLKISCPREYNLRFGWTELKKKKNFKYPGKELIFKNKINWDFESKKLKARKINVKGYAYCEK